MHNILFFLLATINGFFVLFAYFLEKQKIKKKKIGYYVVFSLVNSLIITYGSQTGHLFDGRANANNWITGLLFPVCLYFSFITLAMWQISSKIYLLFKSYVLFSLCFLFALFSILIMAAIILISILGS